MNSLIDKMMPGKPNGLIDAIVYSTGPEDSHSLIDKLMPGKPNGLIDAIILDQKTHIVSLIS